MGGWFFVPSKQGLDMSVPAETHEPAAGNLESAPVVHVSHKIEHNKCVFCGERETDTGIKYPCPSLSLF